MPRGERQSGRSRQEVYATPAAANRPPRALSGEALLKADQVAIDALSDYCLVGEPPVSDILLRHTAARDLMGRVIMESGLRLGSNDETARAAELTRRMRALSEEMPPRS